MLDVYVGVLTSIGRRLNTSGSVSYRASSVSYHPGTSVSSKWPGHPSPPYEVCIVFSSARVARIVTCHVKKDPRPEMLPLSPLGLLATEAPHKRRAATHGHPLCDRSRACLPDLGRGFGAGEEAGQLLQRKGSKTEARLQCNAAAQYPVSALMAAKATGLTQFVKLADVTTPSQTPSYSSSERTLRRNCAR